MATSQYILVTGVAGHIGRAIVPALLAAGYHVRGFDRIAHPTLEDQVVGDITDPVAVERAVAGVDQVVHLAAYVTNAPFVEMLIPANVVGLYRVLSAAVYAGARRLIVGSSIQVIGGGLSRTPRPISVNYAAPDKDYALTKLWAEQYGHMLARNRGVEVIAARIGWFLRNAEEAARMRSNAEWRSVYLAPTDAARFFCAAVGAPKINTSDGYATLYAVGPGAPDHPSPVDLEPGRRLIGYEPAVYWPEETPSASP